MALNEFINSRLGPMVGAFLGRVLSRDQAFRLADFIAARQGSRTRRQNSMVESAGSCRMLRMVMWIGTG